MEPIGICTYLCFRKEQDMIKKKDLMLANRVRYNGAVIAIVGLSEHYLMAQKRATPILYEHIHPIKINGIHLARMGWKVVPSNRTWKHPSCKFPLYEMNGKYGFATKGIEGELHFFLFSEYVHELQNQFYILTKQRLQWQRQKSITNNEQND